MWHEKSLRCRAVFLLDKSQYKGLECVSKCGNKYTYTKFWVNYKPCITMIWRVLDACNFWQLVKSIMLSVECRIINLQSWIMERVQRNVNIWHKIKFHSRTHVEMMKSVRQQQRWNWQQYDCTTSMFNVHIIRTYFMLCMQSMKIISSF